MFIPVHLLDFSMKSYRSDIEVPTWLVGLLVVLVGASFVYGIVVMQRIAAPLMLWLGVASLGGSLFVLYLLYRLVVAVEQIADTL